MVKMRGRKNPSSSQTAPNLPPCKICGEQGTGFHYGVTACGACKGFFRRSLVRKESYVCIGNGNCVIGPETKRRTSCPKCRHNKCLAVGMSKDAIKTGRYSYVKKSHDIIEMIEHHFQHFVKRKQFCESKTSLESLDDDLEVPRKKIRSSCALEKISEVFRQPGSEFMELSPTEPARRSHSVFHFEDTNLGNGTIQPISQINNMIIPETARTDTPKDMSISNDALCPSIHAQFTAVEANDSFPDSCTDFRNPEYLYYFNSPASQPSHSALTPSPLSLASPMSDISNSKESSAPISPSWLELPVYSDNSYSVMTPEDRNSYLAYPDNAYEADLEPCYNQQELSENKGFEYRQTYYATPTTFNSGYEKQRSYSSELSCPFQSYILEEPILYDSPTNRPEHHSSSKQNTPSQITESHHLHTPVSNELGRLRRLSWDDVNFGDDFLSPCYNFVTESLKSPAKNTSLANNVDEKCFHANSNNITHTAQENNKDSRPPEANSNSYWDLDATTPKNQAVTSDNATALIKDQFPFNDSGQIDHASIYSLPVSIQASYKQDGDSSAESSTIGELGHSPIKASTQQEVFDYKPHWSSCEEAVTTGMKTRDRHYSACAEEPSEHPSGSENIYVPTSASTPFSKQDLETEHKVETAVTSETTSAMTSEKSSEPLNFLNIPVRHNIPDVETAVQGHGLDFAFASLENSLEGEKYSHKNEDHDNNDKLTNTENCDDDEVLERWTPFSLGGETPRLIDPDMESEKRLRLQDSDDDYNNKQLPWCEFTEAELDNVVQSLKTSYHRHVVLDTNLLSDEEIAEKLKLFLDILQLREQTFGKFASIDREAYFKILEATGIDLGGRREWVETNAKILNRTLQKTVRFFRSIPGFRDICHEDKIVLAKSCMYEYFILSSYRGVNLEKQVILDAEHKLAVSMDFFRLIAPEMEDHVLDMFELSRKLMDLKLSFEETLILKAISIISPDRDKLKEFEKVDRMYWRLHCCLLLSLWRRLSSPLQFYARIISVITDLRGLAFNGRQIMCNFRPDMLKLTKDIQVPLYLELLFTQADTIPDAESK